MRPETVDEIKHTCQVNISQRAYKIINDFAIKNEMTFSAALEELLLLYPFV